MENGLKTSEMAAAVRLLAGDLFPVARDGGNVKMPAEALQARIWWPEITHLTIAEKSSETDHYALEDVPTAHLVLNGARTIARNQKLPLIICAPWEPADEGSGIDYEIQVWRMSLGNVTASDVEVGIILPADRGAGGANTPHWVRIF